MPAAFSPLHCAAMSRFLIERRLTDVSRRLARARADLAVLDQQLALFSETADDARVRALVAESPLAEREHADARRHADAMARSRAALVSTIRQLETQQGELLERLPARA
jgi:hypothetical protein